MAKRLGIISVIVLLTGLVIYGFKTFFEPWEKTIDRGFSREARINPFLAAEHYLAKLGYDVQSDDSAASLNNLSSVSTLLISQAELVRSESRSRLLEAWLLQGGHLIIEAPSARQLSRHVLLAPLAVSRVKHESNASTTDDQHQHALNEIAGIPGKDEDRSALIPQEQLTQIRFENVSDPVTAYFSPDFILEHSIEQQEGDGVSEEPLPLYQAGNETGLHFIQFQVGEGLLTVVSDSSLWHSSRIDQFDHAYLLHTLSSRMERGEQTVRIIRGTQMPPLTTIVWQAAPELVVAFGLLLATWLVYRSRRFGAVQEPDFSRRRAISEHVRASADFLWRHKRYKALLEPLQQEVIKKTNQRYPGSRSDKNELHRYLADRAGLEAIDVRLALSMPDKVNETGFVRQVALLQKIRESL
ncbi:DUF4350 domain-containing protein [Kistimonas asteriae]|uniref:DUF4350 domain-containing protein n=1 Tax=Kistimonas asteriae TaxID=517724 RepID=UPI001BAC7F4C|nr:DUF4350 domain-containing protein [Kistimonas asteriae]